ncbi:MAG: type II toxin-antitoxin system VapC family toxin [Microvirga sp.]
MMIDASAIVAIMTGEADGDHLRIRMERATRHITHPVSIWEAAVAYRRKTRFAPDKTMAHLDEFRLDAGIGLVPIGEAETGRAILAFGLYGHSSGHPAHLNLGDCFSYAFAEIDPMPLLYKGDDFVHAPLGVSA